MTHPESNVHAVQSGMANEGYHEAGKTVVKEVGKELENNPQITDDAKEKAQEAQAAVQNWWQNFRQQYCCF